MSPFISTILLIALTVGVGSILALWFTSLTGNQTESVSASSDSVSKCAGTSLSIEQVRYPSDASTGRVNVTISSSGGQEMENLTITVAGGGASTTTQKFFNSTPMAPGQSFATSIDVTGGALLPPEIVTATALCDDTQPKRDDCKAGDACMKAI